MANPITGISSERMRTIADYYPVGLSECESIGMSGGCGDDCRLLVNEEYVRFEGECYPYKEYLKVKNKYHMSAIKHLEIE